MISSSEESLTGKVGRLNLRRRGTSNQDEKEQSQWVSRRTKRGWWLACHIENVIKVKAET